MTVTRGAAGPDTEFPLFLAELWAPLKDHKIEDRTAFTPKGHRKGRRDIRRVSTIVLHQMMSNRGNDPRKYDSVLAHFVVLSNGTILRLHPETALLQAAKGFNAPSITVKFAGNFPDTNHRCWHQERFGCHRVTAQQIEAGRHLIRHLTKRFGLTHVLAHRQISGDRPNDPGPQIWRSIGQWAVDTQGLRDGGPGKKIGDGAPIPAGWRAFNALNTEFGPATAGSYPQAGLESSVLQAAIRGGQRNENLLANLIFFRRHPERNGRLISRDEPDFYALSQEWLTIRDRQVRPALGGSTPSQPPSTPGGPYPGRGGGTASWGGHVNGRIPASALCRIRPPSDWLLECGAAKAFILMSEAFRASFGYDLPINDAYRSFERQVEMKEKYRDMAATPGTSNHGWGKAVDLGGTNKGVGPVFDWLTANAGTFGWVHPPWAQPGGSKPESHHWEFGPL